MESKHFSRKERMYDRITLCAMLAGTLLAIGFMAATHDLLPWS